MKQAMLAGLLLLIASIFASPGRASYSGAMDPTFGTNGIRLVDIGRFFPPYQTPDRANALAIQPDGLIVVAGETDWGFAQVPLALTRLLQNGTLDAAPFGDNGRLVGYFSDSVGTSKAYGVAIQPDGRIVVAGTWSDGTTSKMGVARFTGSGVLESRVLPPFSGAGNVLSEGRAVRLQADGKIVVVGSVRYGATSPRSFALARLNPDLTPDSSFFGGGVFTHPPLGTDDEAFAVAIRANGEIVAVGRGRNLAGTSDDVALVRLSSGSGLIDVAGGSDRGNALALPTGGGILIGGSSGSNSMVLKVTDAGVFDNNFGAGGRFLVPGAPIVALALQADAKILALTQDFQLLRLTAPGTQDATFGIVGRVVLPVPAGSTASAMALQADGRVVVVGTTSSGPSPDFLIARLDPVVPVEPTPSAVLLDFGAQSMNTTTPPLTLTLTNGSGASVPLGTLGASYPFAIAATSCGSSVPANNSCDVSVTFTPMSEGPQAGRMYFGSSAVMLAGVGEKSLVTHYYRSILRRAPDSGGKSFWESEAARSVALGLNVNETWFAMAQLFYTSLEYANLVRDNTGFATDLYNTFYNRPPDSAGLAYWKGQLDSGLSREVAVTSFMFSTEFVNFSTAIFGAQSTRAEVNMVTDFYRGLLARLPDDAGFDYWIGRFRAAQCQGSTAIIAEVEAISNLFLSSPEYLGRGRLGIQYVGDLYNAFLRRGGDQAGVGFWIQQMVNGQTREELRVQFKNSPEFQARVASVVAQGCGP